MYVHCQLSLIQKINKSELLG